MQVHSHARKDLMTFTCMGKPLAAQVLRSQYLVILSKIEHGDLSVRARTVFQTVMKARHVFRGGTSIDSDKAQERKIHYTGTHSLTHASNAFDCALTHTLHTPDLIAECKNERSTAGPVVRSASTAAGRRTVRARKIELVGRRVIMSADVFGGNDKQCYHGKVVGKSKYRQNDKTCNGFKVLWHNGDVDYWYTYLWMSMYICP